MDSIAVKAFLSCSFRPDDHDVVVLFHQICKALDIDCQNVSGAYKRVPAEQARKMIAASDLCIVIASRREEISEGFYRMPEAVNEELSIAYGKEKPILLFVEKGVQIDGMKTGYCTYATFDSDSLWTSDQISSIIKSLHEEKLELIPVQSAHQTQVSRDKIIRSNKFLIELRPCESELRWFYTLQAKIEFFKDIEVGLPLDFWAGIAQAAESSEPISVDVELIEAPKNMKAVLTNVTSSSTESKNLLEFDPKPQKGDVVEYWCYVNSPHLNCRYKDETSSTPPLRIGGKEYHCFDGFLTVHRVQHAMVEIRFPSGYGLSARDVVFFVGNYGNGVDYLVSEEIERANVEIDEIGGNVRLRATIDNPLFQLLYGFAWNPPVAKPQN